MGQGAPASGQPQHRDCPHWKQGPCRSFASERRREVELTSFSSSSCLVVFSQLDLVSSPPSTTTPASISEDDDESTAPEDNSAAVAEQESLRQVPKEEAKAYAEEAGLLFFETSAKTGEMVSEVFTEIGKSSRRLPLSPRFAPSSRPALVPFHPSRYITVIDATTQFNG